MDDKKKALVTHTHPQGTSEHSHGHDHEHSDIKIRPIFLSIVVLLAVTALSCVAVWGIFEFAQARHDASTVEISPLLDTVMVPPKPRLQVNERKDLAEVRGREDSLLGSSGVVDSAGHVMRIPIAQAIDIIAERGTPNLTTPTPAPAQSDTIGSSAQPSSGITTTR
jgi:hypothetical protein